MPIYEYQCAACGHELEAIQKVSEPRLTDCDACGQPELRKKISAAGFRLKGGGWYETDFKAGNKKNLAGDAAKGGDAKADSKGASDSSTGNSNPDSSSSSGSASGNSTGTKAAAS